MKKYPLFARLKQFITNESSHLKLSVNCIYHTKMEITIIHLHKETAIHGRRKRIIE